MCLRMRARAGAAEVVRSPMQLWASTSFENQRDFGRESRGCASASCAGKSGVIRLTAVLVSHAGFVADPRACERVVELRARDCKVVQINSGNEGLVTIS